MAELTTLDEKIGEVLGLAMAAQGVTDKVKRLVDDEEIAQELQRTHDEAAEIEGRCTGLIEGFDGKKTAILEKARETKQEANEMMSTYLGEDADGLDGFEFLTMAEAGEVGHWTVVAAMNERAGNAELQEIVDWALPLQQQHLQRALEGSVRLAAAENPNEPA
ncbi:MAG TPA: hypothetical protein VHK22_08525 [Gaiellaceae bacterium]|jgi:hypothetical protein|nr:hypothetical protein [Gaiellaceae bacterium]